MGAWFRSFGKERRIPDGPQGMDSIRGDIDSFCGFAVCSEMVG